MPPRKKSAARIDVESLRHKDKRANIPTEELRGFAADDEAHPATMLYPRDPTIDPQLVWKGKDEQDRKDLEVPVVPIYIQEKIHPQAIIEEVRIRGAIAEPQAQLDLFSDFNGIDTFEKKVDFYRWPMNWSNRMVLGDSLLAMTSLAEKEGLKGAVQMIYIDPPYGIRFGSNWQVSTRKNVVRDGRVEDMAREPEVVKAFRDTWEKGVHSYLAYLRDRFTVARDLLTETGSVFVQIGDENTHLARCLLDEVFGSDNFIANIAFKKKKMPLGETYIFSMCDYLLWYGKDATRTKFRKLFLNRNDGADGDFGLVEVGPGQVRSLSSFGDGTLPTGSRLFQAIDLRSSGRTESCVFEVDYGGRRFAPSSGKSWKTNRPGMDVLIKANRVHAAADTLRYSCCSTIIRYRNSATCGSTLRGRRRRSTWYRLRIGSSNDAC